MTFKPAVNQTAFAKIGSQGKPGSGKTTLLALLAIYLSKTYHNGAPIAFLDSEKGSDFVIPIFKAEKVELLVKKSKALVDLRTASRDALAAGCCCVIADSITKFWIEASKALKEEKNVKRLSVDLIGRLKDEWLPFADDFVESKIHFLVAGRLGYDWENAEFEEDGQIKKELMKMGSKMKAESDFGHDFDLSIEMSAMEDPDALQYEKLRKKGLRKKFTASGLHVATIKKCRTWSLNGQVFRWPDQPGYKVGYYEEVGKSFKPYFNSLSIGGEHNAQDGATSNILFQNQSDSSYYEARVQRDIMLEKWDGAMSLIAGGQTKESITRRAIIGRNITGTLSKTEFERQPFLDIERQVLTLLVLEKLIKQMPPKDEDALLDLITAAQNTVQDHPGADLTLLEAMQGKTTEEQAAMHDPF